MLEPDDPDAADEPRVFRLSPDADERWLVGSSLARWLDSTLAHEQLLYEPDGEFLLDAFEEDGEELTPDFAVRQAERALKKDPAVGAVPLRAGAGAPAPGPAPAGAGLVRRRRRRWIRPTPGPGSTSAAASAQLGQMRQAAAAFECAAEASSGGERGRFLVWSARSMFEAGDRATADKLLEEARLSSPGPGRRADPRRPGRRGGFGGGRRRRRSAGRASRRPTGREDAEELAALVTHGLPARRKLPVLREGLRHPGSARPAALARLPARPSKAAQGRPADRAGRSLPRRTSRRPSGIIRGRSRAAFRRPAGKRRLARAPAAPIAAVEVGKASARRLPAPSGSAVARSSRAWVPCARPLHPPAQVGRRPVCASMPQGFRPPPPLPPSPRHRRLDAPIAEWIGTAGALELPVVATPVRQRLHGDRSGDVRHSSRASAAERESQRVGGAKRFITFPLRGPIGACPPAREWQRPRTANPSSRQSPARSDGAGRRRASFSTSTAAMGAAGAEPTRRSRPYGSASSPKATRSPAASLPTSTRPASSSRPGR